MFSFITAKNFFTSNFSVFDIYVRFHIATYQCMWQFLDLNHSFSLITSSSLDDILFVLGYLVSCIGSSSVTFVHNQIQATICIDSHAFLNCVTTSPVVGTCIFQKDLPVFFGSSSFSHKSTNPLWDSFLFSWNLNLYTFKDLQNVFS